jgi:hypothetical protein
MENFREQNYLNESEKFNNNSRFLQFSYDPLAKNNTRFNQFDYSGKASRSMYEYTAEVHLSKSKNYGIDYLLSLEGYKDTFNMDGSGIRYYSYSTGNNKMFSDRSRFSGSMTAEGFLKTGISYKTKISENQSLFIDLLIGMPYEGRYRQETFYQTGNDSPDPNSRLGWVSSPVIYSQEKISGSFNIINGGSYQLGYAYNISSSFRIRISANGSFSYIHFHSGNYFSPLNMIDYLYMPGYDYTVLPIYLMNFFGGGNAKDRMNNFGMEFHYNY